MLHTFPLITTISVALALALIFGLLAAYLKIPVLVGYLVAGILIGPHTPGFVGNMDIRACQKLTFLSLKTHFLGLTA